MGVRGACVRVTSTAAGHLFVLFALGCLGIGVGYGQRALVMVALFLMCIFLLARHIARWNVSRVTVSQVLPRVVYSGEHFAITLVVTHVGGRMDAFGIELRHEAVTWRDRGRQTLDVVHGGGSSQCQITGRVNQRGLVRVFSCGLGSTFPFGLWRARRQIALPCRLVVAPQPLRVSECPGFAGVGAHLEGVQSSASVERMGEFRSLREYRHGDPARMISWSRSAQLNRVIVREAERLAPARVRVLFHSYQPQGVLVRPRGVERSLRQLAGLFELLRRQGVGFDFQGSVTDWELMSGDEGDRFSAALLACLASARFSPSDDLDEVFAALRSADGVVGSVIVVSPVPITYWSTLVPVSRVPVLCLDNDGFQGAAPVARGRA